MTVRLLRRLVRRMLGRPARRPLVCKLCGHVVPYLGNPWEQGDRAYTHWEDNHG